MIIKRNKHNKYAKEPQEQVVFQEKKEDDICSQQDVTNPSDDSFDDIDSFPDLSSEFDDGDQSLSIDSLLSQYEDEVEAPAEPEPQVVEEQDYTQPIIDIPSVENRREKRRGDRRRGYRRLDDRNLISRAQEEANAIKERAAKEGFDYGISVAQGELQKLNGVMIDFLNAKEYALEALSPQISFLAVKVAEKIIRTEVSCDETIILNIVKEVLKGVGKDETQIVIRANPADAIIVRSSIPEIYPYAGVNTKVIVMEDKDIEWGSCLVETNNGMIDARFSTQLQILIKAFEAGL